MYLTFKIGLSFIWVDALCIAQDSHEDWEIESAKMGAVYAGAYVTIAANANDSVGKGFFVTNSKTQHCLSGAALTAAFFEIKSTLTNGQQSCLYMNSRTVNSSLPLGLEGSLDERGWAFQERLLSRRILNFTPYQMFWECEREYAAEDGYLTWRTEGESHTIPGSMLKLYALRPHSEENHRVLMRRWYNEIAESYSERQLTNVESDKLIAYR